MNDTLPWLSLSNEIEVKGELRNFIVRLKNNKETDESYPTAYFLFCGPDLRNIELVIKKLINCTLWRHEFLSHKLFVFYVIYVQKTSRKYT